MPVTLAKYRNFVESHMTIIEILLNTSATVIQRQKTVLKLHIILQQTPKYFMEKMESYLVRYSKDRNYISIILVLSSNSLANIYLFKVNNRNTRKWCRICLKLAI